MARLELDVAVETLRLAQPFRISGHVFTHSDVVVVTLRDGDLKGRGEGGGVYYLGDDVPHMLYTIGAARSAIEAGPTREELRSIMPAGGARNAVDCALWELEAARAGVPVWKLAGQTGAATASHHLHARCRHARGDGRRCKALCRRAVDQGQADRRAGARHCPRKGDPRGPAGRLAGVDGNQGFVVEQLDELVAALKDAGRLAARAAARTRAARPISRATGRLYRSPETRAC